MISDWAEIVLHLRDGKRLRFRLSGGILESDDGYGGTPWDDDLLEIACSDPTLTATAAGNTRSGSAARERGAVAVRDARRLKPTMKSKAPKTNSKLRVIRP